MGKKGKKKDPNAPTLIPEDVFVRATKLKSLGIAVKPPKGGEFTPEEWCIPPALHSIPELKSTIHYWQECAIVHFVEKDLKAPSRMKVVETDQCVKKPHPRKEIQDLFKFLKSQVKAANKRTGQFLKQLTKKEGKETKRETLLKTIADLDRQMNDELRSARTFSEKQELFKYMQLSKLGTKAPRKSALIVIEQSDKMAQWIDEAKDEVNKLLNGVIALHDCETFNVALFSVSTVTQWCPQYQPKGDPKKGLPDAIKWINKQFSAKTCGSQPFPPDWTAMFKKVVTDAAAPPFRIYLVCSKSPEGAVPEVTEWIRNYRETNDPPGKGEPVLPVNVVAFDPTIVGDGTEKTYFDNVAGANGEFLIDTSAEDLVALDKMLKSVQVAKKKLDKHMKKLDRMEDLSEKVAEDRACFQTQAALQRMLENDFEICDWALKNETPVAGPEI